MSRTILRESPSPSDYVAALGAAYERYVATLRALKRLRSRQQANDCPQLADQLMHADCLAQEAYMRWLTLARSYLPTARRAGDEGSRA